MSAYREKCGVIPVSGSGPVRNRLKYGINEATGWREFATGGHREQIRDRLRVVGTRLVRIYVFDRYTPDPVRDWPNFARYVQAVLDAGARPMITLTKFRPPFDDVATTRWFVERCGELAWNCIEHWGGDAVREWHWCIWNEPNSGWISPGFTFEQYKRIYLAVAGELVHWLGPYLEGRRAMIGGPAVDTFQPFWFDWLWRFVHEIDNAFVGFVLWHRFGDWRAPGEWGAPVEPAIYRRLLMERTGEYAEIAATVSRLVSRHGILNVCGRLNASAHDEPRVSGPINQGIVGAVYYACALLHLIRGGADGELYWLGTDGVGSHGLWDGQARASLAFRVKELVAPLIRYGDDILVHEPRPGRRELMLAEVTRRDVHHATLILHLDDGQLTCSLPDTLGNGVDYTVVRKIDEGTSGCIATMPYDGTITLDGLGVAVAVINAALGR
jgi:hypothetical protein